MSGAFDRLLAPFGGHADLALAVVSLVCGALTMVIFKAASNQDAIRRTRARLMGHVLEMRIYQDDVVLILGALGATLAANLRYLRLVAWPILIVALVVGVAVMQIDARFGRSRLRAEEAAMVTVTYRPGVDVMSEGTRLEGAGGAVEMARVRVPARREVGWRVQVQEPLAPTVTLHANDATYRFALATGPGTGLVGDQRSRSALSEFLHPGLPRLSNDVPIERVDVRYPPARHRLLGWSTHWLVVFAAWSLLGALIPKLLLRIEV